MGKRKKMIKLNEIDLIPVSDSDVFRGTAFLHKLVMNEWRSNTRWVEGTPDWLLTDDELNKAETNGNNDC